MLLFCFAVSSSLRPRSFIRSVLASQFVYVHCALAISIHSSAAKMLLLRWARVIVIGLLSFFRSLYIS